MLILLELPLLYTLKTYTQYQMLNHTEKMGPVDMINVVEQLSFFKLGNKLINVKIVEFCPF